MTRREAYALGIESGYEAGQYGDFSQEELSNEDSFIGAGLEICDNKRQYADSPTYEIALSGRSETLFDAFDAGELSGLKRAWRERKKKHE